MCSIIKHLVIANSRSGRVGYIIIFIVRYTLKKTFHKSDLQASQEENNTRSTGVGGYRCGQIYLNKRSIKNTPG